MIRFYHLVMKLCLVLFLVTGAGTGAWAQSRSVSGRVTSSDDGSPVPGVNVLEKGTNNGTVTDSDGRFTLQVSGSNAVLVFSFVGYATQEVTVGTQSTINVNLQVDVTALQEVVVVAMARLKRKILPVRLCLWGRLPSTKV